MHVCVHVRMLKSHSYIYVLVYQERSEPSTGVAENSVSDQPMGVPAIPPST